MPPDLPASAAPTRPSPPQRTTVTTTRELTDALTGPLQVIDLSRPYEHGMPQSPNHPPYRHAYTRRHGDMVRADGGSAAADMLSMGPHVGTHIDALAHVSHDGHLHGGVDVIEGRRAASTGPTASTRSRRSSAAASCSTSRACSASTCATPATRSPPPTSTPPSSARAPRSARAMPCSSDPAGRSTGTTATATAGSTTACPAPARPRNEVMAPGEDEVARARDLVARFEAAAGGVCLDAEGRMVDEAVVRSARRLLARLR